MAKYSSPVWHPLFIVHKRNKMLLHLQFLMDSDSDIFVLFSQVLFTIVPHRIINLDFGGSLDLW